MNKKTCYETHKVVVQLSICRNRGFPKKNSSENVEILTLRTIISYACSIIDAECNVTALLQSNIDCRM